MSASAAPNCPRDGAPTLDGPAPEYAPGSRVFDRFEIGEPIARGATGTVYRVRDAAGNTVALKVLHAELTKSPLERSRLKRELGKAASVQHPRIAKVREIGETEGRMFLVRDHVDGDALASVLHRDGPMSAGQAARIVHAVAGALAEAHRAGVLHRDINPRHVMIQSDGNPTLLDFTLSAPIPGGVAGKPAWGSIPYLAPEQAAGKLVTLRADLYGLGLVLYEMLAGAPPPLPDDPASALAARVRADLPPAPDGVPVEISQLLAQLLAQDPKDRPFGARHVEKVLAEQAASSEARPTTAPLRSSVPAPRISTTPTPLPTLRISQPRASTLPMRASVELPGLQPGTSGELPPDPGDDLAHDAGESIEIVGRVARRRDQTAVIGSEPESAGAATKPPGDPPGRKPGKTLVGIPLPTAADPPTEVRQAWARSVLGLERTPPKASSSDLGLPPTLEPPRRMVTAQGATPAPAVPEDPVARISTAQGAAPAPRPAHPPVPQMPTAPTAPEPRPAPPARIPPARSAPPVAASSPPSPRPAKPTPPPAPPMPAEAVAPAPTVEAQSPPRLDQTSEELSYQDVEVEPEARLSADQLEAAARALASSHVAETPPRASKPAAVPITAPAEAASVPAPRPAPDPWSTTEPSVTLTKLPGVRRRGWMVGVIGLVVVFGGLGIGLGVAGPWRSQPPVVASGPPAAPVDPRLAPPGAPGTLAQPPAPLAPTPQTLAVDAGAADAATVVSVDAAAPTTTADAATPTRPDAAVTQVASAPLVAPGPADDDPRSTRDLIKLARLHIRRRNLDEAQRVFEKVVRREPENLDATLGLALVAVTERRFDDAVAAFQRATALKPDSAVLHVYLGNALLMRGDRTEAEAQWRRALEIDPRQREARTRLGGGGRRAPRRGRIQRQNPYR